MIFKAVALVNILDQMYLLILEVHHTLLKVLIFGLLRFAKSLQHLQTHHMLQRAYKHLTRVFSNYTNSSAMNVTPDTSNIDKLTLMKNNSFRSYINYSPDFTYNQF